MAKPKTTKIAITVTLEIDNRSIYDKETLIKDLIDQHVWVKSGLYENGAFGYVETAVIA